MKKKCLLIVLFLCNVTFSQLNLERVKCDSFLVFKDSIRVLLYKKKKGFVYDLESKKMLCKPIKNSFFYLKEQDLFVLFNEDQVILKHVPLDGNVAEISSDLSEISIGFPSALSSKYDSLVLVNGIYFNYMTGDSIQDENTLKRFYTQSKLDLKIHNNRLVAVNYVAHPLEGEDEFDQDILVDKGFTKSGLFDRSTNEWVIPQKYYSCSLIGSDAVCCHRDTIFYQMSADGYHGAVMTSYSYDQYSLGDNKAEKVASAVLSAEEFEVSSLFSVDSLEPLGNDMFRSYKDNNQGLIKVALEDGVYEPIFDYSKFINAEYDLVIWNEENQMAMTYSSNDTFPISIFKNGELIEYNSVQGDVKSEIFVGWFDEEDEKFDALDLLVKDDLFSGEWLVSDFPLSFGIKPYNDSLLLVYDQQESVISDLPLVDEYGYDLIEYSEIEGEEFVLYEVIVESRQKSGVFNLNTGKWLFERKYSQIYVYPNGFLCSKREVKGGEVKYKYDFYDRGGEVKFQNYFNDLNREEVVKLMFDAEAIFRATDSYFHSKNNERYQYQKGYNFYLLKDEQYYLHNSRNVEYEPIRPKRFIYNTERAMFYAERDSLFLEVADTVFAVSEMYGLLKTEIVQGKDEKLLEVTVLEKYDVYNTYHYSCGLYPNAGEEFMTKVEVVDGDLIINTRNKVIGLGTFEQEMIEFGDCEELQEYNLANYESESSSIWKKEGEVWRKQTPYYASVHSLSFGFLVSTGSYSEYDCGSSIHMNEEKRFIVLDKNYKPISYYDYYDFEDVQMKNGLMLKTGQGYFFVNNNGRVITTDKWDDFMFVGDRLKAIIYGRNSEGKILKDTIERVEFFDYK